jgi:hypothetical protein
VTFPTPDQGAAQAPVRNGRAGPDVVPDPARDPAHRGPLPDANFAELVGRLINDVSDLADRQIDLAKQEIGVTREQAVGAAIKLAIGAGVILTAVLLAVIWLWTAFIWFFNWLGAFVQFPTPLGTQSLAWIGWPLGVLVPALAGFIAYKRYVRTGIDQATTVWPPLPRTQETLKEDLAWVRRLRTRSVR